MSKLGETNTTAATDGADRWKEHNWKCFHFSLMYLRLASWPWRWYYSYMFTSYTEISMWRLYSSTSAECCRLCPTGNCKYNLCFSASYWRWKSTTQSSKRSCRSVLLSRKLSRFKSKTKSSLLNVWVRMNVRSTLIIWNVWEVAEQWRILVFWLDENNNLSTRPHLHREEQLKTKGGGVI